MVLENRRAGGINNRRRKTFFFTLMIIFLFAVLLVRVWYLQIVKGERFGELSENNRIRIVTVKAHRGKIMDRERRVLVDNRPSFNLSVVPEDVKKKDFKKVLDFLQQKIPLRKKTVLKKLKSVSPFRSMIIERDINRDAMAFVAEHRYEVPWLELNIEPMREYKYKKLAAHLVGYLGEIDERSLKKSRKSSNSYQLGDLIGQFGAEKIYEDYLRGENGRRQIEVDAYGRELKFLREEEFSPGNNVILTIDLRLQEFAEKLFADQEGSIIVMNPQNGEILAMVSKPSFDPNLFAKGITRESWLDLIQNKTHPLQNRAIQGQYPPGSVFKIVTATAGLEERVIDPEKTIFDKGYFYFGKRIYRDWKEGGHGRVNLHRAIVESCDTYFYQVGTELGIDVLARYAEGFGLGQPTGIGLENEKEGVVPSTQWKKKARKEVWFPGETVSASIGQGYNLVTPIQLATLISSVANGGIRYRPRILKRIETPEGAVVLESQPEIMGRIPARPKTLELIRRGLLGVVNESGGTARRAQIKDILVAGKTGTAQVIAKKEDEPDDYQEKLPRRMKDHGWFVCFAPFENPELAIVVLGEHGGKHGSFYAPIARQIILEYFRLKKEDNPQT